MCMHFAGNRELRSLTKLTEYQKTFFHEDCKAGREAGVELARHVAFRVGW